MLLNKKVFFISFLRALFFAPVFVSGVLFIYFPNQLIVPFRPELPHQRILQVAVQRNPFFFPLISAGVHTDHFLSG
jgi:hypothetical protein